MARTPYADPEAEKEYQSYADKSAKPSVDNASAVDGNVYLNTDERKGWEEENRNKGVKDRARNPTGSKSQDRNWWDPTK